MPNLPEAKDPLTTAIEKSIEESAKIAKDFLDKMMAGPLEQGGGLLSDTIEFWRFKNKVNLVLKAKKFLEDKGINPKAVLPKTVVPILEAGSLEADESMKEKWASLLANAAASPNSVPPAFPRILAELSTYEAQLLQEIFDDLISGDDTRVIMPDDGPSYGEGIPFGDREALAHNLNRLGLIEASYTGYMVSEPFVSVTRSYSKDHIKLTRLGVKCMEACSMQSPPTMDLPKTESRQR